MAIAVQQIYPLAPCPVVLGVLRCLEGAAVIDNLIAPHPAPVLSTGHGLAALGLALLAGDHALYKVGPRLEERGMRALLQPGLTRASLHDSRWGHLLDALCAAKLPKGLSALALTALAGDAIPPPWLPQATTTMALSGASAGASAAEPKSARAPRPASGPSAEGRDALKQGRLRLGGRGAGGLPLRGGGRDGPRRERGATPGALEAELALGREGGRGIGAARQAARRRPGGLGRERPIGRGTLGPRPCALRLALEPWGRQPPALPLWVAQPGRTQEEAPRCWPGHRRLRHVAVEDSAGRVALEARRFVRVHASPLAPPQPAP
jgi:hypothetical protein